MRGLPDPAHRARILQDSVALIEQVRRARFTQLLELLRVCTGSKPAIRLIVNDREAGSVERAARRLGLTFRPTRVRMVETYRDGLGNLYTHRAPWSTGGPFSVFVGPEGHIEHLAEEESSRCSDQVLGRGLGLPQCCIEAQVRRRGGQSWIAPWFERARPGFRYSAWSNALVTPLSGWNPAGEYDPCRPGCRGTAIRAREGLRVAKAFGLTGLVKAWRDNCCRPIVSVEGALLFLPMTPRPEAGRIPLRSTLVRGSPPLDFSKALREGTDLRVDLRAVTIERTGEPLLTAMSRLVRFRPVGPR